MTPTSKPAGKATVRLSQVNRQGQPKELAVDFDGATLHLTYDRSEYTPAVEQQMTEMVGEGRVGAGLATMLIKVLRSWNLTDEEDQPLPLTSETLNLALSVDAQTAIVVALGDDQRPKPPTAEMSPDF